MATKYQGSERRSHAPQGDQGDQGVQGGGGNNSWHLERKVTISVIFAIFAIVVNGIWAVVDIRQNVALLSQRQESDSRMLREQDNKASDALREGLGIVRSQYDQLSGKLDRLIERGGK